MQTKHLITDRTVRVTPVGCEASIVINSPGLVHVDQAKGSTVKRAPNVLLTATECGALYRTPGSRRRFIVIRLPTEEASEGRFAEEFDYLVGMAKLKGEL